MTIFREALIWIVLLVFNLINTFLVLIGKTNCLKHLYGVHGYYGDCYDNYNKYIIL